MPLIAQALTTLANVRSYLNLYTLTAVTSTETLTSDTANITFSFANTDLAPNLFGTFSEVVGTASDTISTALITIAYDLGTATFSAARTGNITISSYSYFAWDYSKDKLLERNINSVSSMISKYCNRNFIADTYSEFYKGSGRQRLVLNQYPINEITSVKVDSASLTAGIDYVTSDQTYLDEGIVFKNDGWTWYGYLTGLVGELTAPVDNIEVIYSAGFTLQPESIRNFPWDLEDVTISMVADLYGEQQDANVGLKQLTQGKLSYTWDTNPLIQQYSSVLDGYRKAVF
jgi:hypothetical protein